MESFLDEFCLTSTNDVQHEDFELKFRYSFLAPPVDSPNFDEHDPEGREMVENRGERVTGLQRGFIYLINIYIIFYLRKHIHPI